MVAARPRHPAGEQQRADARPRLVVALGRGERLVEQHLGLVDVGVDVDRDVAEEPQRERERERVVDLAAELHRPVEHVPGRRVLAEPVPGLADAGERARLADAPRVLGTRERERPLVAVDRRPALHPAPRAVARVEQRLGGALGHRSVVAVEVERRDRRELEVVGRPRRVAVREQPVGDQLVQPDALALGQARVRDLLQRRVADAPARLGVRVVLGHEDLGLLELPDLVRGGLGVDRRGARPGRTRRRTTTRAG